MSISISVVVPTCARADLLSRCLDSLAPGRQSFDADRYEVIVSDDGQDLESRDMVRNRYAWARWVEGPRRGPAANRNNGARQASGLWLAFIDDDCIASPDWLKSVWRCAQLPGVDGVEGKTVIPDKVDNPFLRGIENLNGGLYWSCNLALRRSHFEKLGGFDEDFLEAGGEDMELAWRMKQNKIEVRFEPEAMVLHPVRPVGLRTLIWRTALSRWMLLYYHKTGQAPALSTSPLLAAAVVVRRELTNTARRLWRFCRDDLRSLSSSHWRTSLFYQAWSLLTLPFTIPYLVVWEMRYRKMLKSRPPAKK